MTMFEMCRTKGSATAGPPLTLYKHQEATMYPLYHNQLHHLRCPALTLH